MGLCCSTPGKDDPHSRGRYNLSEADKEYFYNYNALRKKSIIRPMNVRRKSTPLDKISLEQIVRENIQVRYVFEKMIGEGAFGKVNIACLRSNPTKKFAIKSIPRDILDQAGAANQQFDEQNDDSEEV